MKKLKQKLLLILFTTGVAISASAHISEANSSIISTTAVEPAGNLYDQGKAAYDSGDFLNAFRLFGLASKEGNHDAQYYIGLMYRDGKGTDVNPKDAAYWFRKAASNGHAPSQYEIAKCFAIGYGVLQDSRVAAEWYWRAAQQGLTEAQYELGNIYLNGNGMPVNEAKALEYFSKSAEKGFLDSHVKVSRLKAKSNRIRPQTHASKKSSRK